MLRGGGWLDSNLNLAEVELTCNDWKIGVLGINTSLCPVINKGAGHQATAHNLQAQHNVRVEELNQNR